MMLLRTTLFAVLTLLLTAGCGTTRPGGSGAVHNPKEQASADALLAGAVRRQSADQALPLIKAEAERSPNRIEIVWLYSQLCTQVSGCDSTAIEAHVRKLDPGNAAAWIGALARARAARDTAAEEAVLDAISRSQHFDLYWNALVARLADAIIRIGPPNLGTGAPDPVTSGLNEAIGWLSAVALPAFKPVTEACDNEHALNPAVAARCLRISETMLRGDTYIVEAVGLGIRERLATPGTPEAVSVSEQIKISRYQRETASKIMEAQIERQKLSTELLQLMKKLHREQDVFTTVIRWAGQPLLPQEG